MTIVGGQLPISPALKESLQRYLREMAQKIFTAEKNPGESPYLKRHAAALGALDSHLEALDPEDQRLRALALIAEARRERETFTPGKQQKVLLQVVGESGPPPPADDVLNELVVCGLSDLIDFLAEKAQQEISAARAVETDIEENREAEEQLRAAEHQEQLSSAIGRAEDLEAECEELREQLEFLQGFLKSNGVEPKPKAKTRRTKVEGETGVYWSDTTAGRMYEINFTGPDGKTKWKTIGPDLEEAIEARKALTESGKELVA